MQLNIRKLTLSEAKNRIAAIDSLEDIAFEDLINHWIIYDVAEESYDSTYKEFRAELIDCFKSALEGSGGKMNYTLDLRMGINCMNFSARNRDLQTFRQMMTISGDIFQSVLCLI